MNRFFRYFYFVLTQKSTGIIERERNQENETQREREREWLAATEQNVFHVFSFLSLKSNGITVFIVLSLIIIGFESMPKTILMYKCLDMSFLWSG